MNAGTAAAAMALLLILGALALLIRRGRAQEAHAEQGLQRALGEAEPLAPFDYRGHLPLDDRQDGGHVDAFVDGLRDGVIQGLADAADPADTDGASSAGAGERERRVAELAELLAVDEQVRRQVAVLVIASLGRAA